MPVMDMTQENNTGVKLTKNVIKPVPDQRVIELMRYQYRALERMWTIEANLFTFPRITGNMTSSFTYQCESIIYDEKLMKMLEEEKFDVGITEVFDICGLGIFELINIPATVSTFAVVHSDLVSESIGEPTMPSFVPAGMSVKGDRMDIVERFMNMANVILGKILFSQTFIREINVFRAKFGAQFKDYNELIAKSSFIFTNSNPYLDYPRPTIHK
ncbi:hypothetical protein DICVIV_09703, partial [Dictyocaulus viviparus]